MNSNTLRNYLISACKSSGVTLHESGTCVTIEGPAFSTKAESNLYRSWGCNVVGMTQVQEAKLCREAEISYATCALATDYDCWRPGHDDVTVDEVQLFYGNLLFKHGLFIKMLLFFFFFR